MDYKIKLEPLHDRDGNDVGIICDVNDPKNTIRYIVTCRYYEDHEVWTCKRRTPSSSIFVGSDELDRVIEQYDLKRYISEHTV